MTKFLGRLLELAIIAIIALAAPSVTKVWVKDSTLSENASCGGQLTNDLSQAHLTLFNFKKGPVSR